MLTKSHHRRALPCQRVVLATWLTLALIIQLTEAQYGGHSASNAILSAPAGWPSRVSGGHRPSMGSSYSSSSASIPLYRQPRPPSPARLCRMTGNCRMADHGTTLAPIARTNNANTSSTPGLLSSTTATPHAT